MMNFAKLFQRAFFTLGVSLLACAIAQAQGTTGTTAGSGRGTGSAGVQTGTGPDTSVSPGENRQVIVDTPAKEKTDKPAKKAQKPKKASE